MADNFQSFKVASNEQSSSSKFNNLVQALEDAINSLDNSNIAAAAAIAASKLAAGSNGDFLQTVAGVPTWGPGPSQAGYSTSLPGSPSNGQEHILVDSTTSPTYAWRFRFNSAKSSNKWDAVGAPILLAETLTSETTSSASYANLSGGATGPSIVIPVAGVYRVGIGCTVSNGTNTVNSMSYDIGGTAAVDADRVINETVGAVGATSVSRWMTKTLTAVTLTSKYKTGGGTATFLNRWLAVEPVAIGG